MAPYQPQVLEHVKHVPTQGRLTGSRMQCLVVAGNPSRRSDLVATAREAGWITVESDNTEAALECGRRLRFQLLVVDLTGTRCSEQDPLRHVIERLCTRSDLLTAVCGGDGCPDEEIWARQLGVWVYLPGLVGTHELSGLWGEALEIASRLAMPSDLVPAMSANPYSQYG